MRKVTDDDEEEEEEKMKDYKHRRLLVAGEGRELSNCPRNPTACSRSNMLLLMSWFKLLCF